MKQKIHSWSDLQRVLIGGGTMLAIVIILVIFSFNLVFSIALFLLGLFFLILVAYAIGMIVEEFSKWFK